MPIKSYLGKTLGVGSKNCHCLSCQCSVDPVLSSHDAPYFETYLSSQAIEKGIGNGAPVFAFLVFFFFFFSFCLPTRSPLPVKMTLLEENVYDLSNNLKT